VRRPLVILVVEDEPTVRRFMALVLRNDGHEVIEAGTGAACLQLVELRAGAVDLVITDLIMPNMGGLDLAAELDRRYPGLKILYISGYANSIATQGIARKAPELVLLKPFTVDELIDRIGLLCP
jgi:two-component system, cell cycle sensor histidine kinase and response regulator CckA